MYLKDVTVGENTKIWYPEKSNIYGCSIGDNCNIGALVEIRKEVVIGNNCKIQAFVFIPEGVTIGNYVFIGPHVCFTNDKYPKSFGDWEKQYTVVEDLVSVGAGAVICPGVTLGRGCMVAAGSVVTKNVERNTLVAGNPAKVLRSLNNE
jgi:acetyltransferase-like isoleucine patch superfamily enzyme